MLTWLKNLFTSTKELQRKIQRIEAALAVAVELQEEIDSLRGERFQYTKENKLLVERNRNLQKELDKYKKNLIDVNCTDLLEKNSLLFKVVRQENNNSNCITFEDHDGFQYFSIQSLLGRFLAGKDQNMGEITDIWNEVENYFQIAIARYAFDKQPTDSETSI